MHAALAIAAALGCGWFLATAARYRSARRVLIALVALAAAGGNAAEAATPTDIVSAQFRHVALHRIIVADDVTAADVTTGCLQRRAAIWECGAITWDAYHQPAIVRRFRFTVARGVSGYAGPSGPRWAMTLPYGRRRHRHLVGRITLMTLGQPF